MIGLICSTEVAGVLLILFTFPRFLASIISLVIVETFIPGMAPAASLSKFSTPSLLVSSALNTYSPA